MKKFLVILLTGSLIFANSAFAARFGSGRSSGMQRSTATSYNNSGNRNYSTYPQGTTYNGANNPQQRSGMGAGTAAVLGAAAGAAGGYMLGRNSNNQNINTNASGVTSSAATAPSSSIPWGSIAILVAILALGLMFFRKKTSPKLFSNPMNNNYSSPNSGNYTMQNTNRVDSGRSPIINSKSALATPNPEQMSKMPDGIETLYFLRQVKGMFLHIQSMNNPENLGEIQKYMTNELFEATQNDVATNQVVADFPTLDCVLLETETSSGSKSADGSTIEIQLIASVKFFGMISEDPQQPPKPFSEIWNFVKSSRTNNKWLVAGIQQDSVS